MRGEAGLQPFGIALKAFRRGVHQFPSAWRAVVVCTTTSQYKCALTEAVCILNGGSLPILHVNEIGRKIETEKGGLLKFVVLNENFHDCMRGQDFPQMILLSGVAEETKGFLERHNRYPTIDPKYCSWHECTL
jgi:fatty acid/phospholipid biosynthesis enzyme